MDSEEMKPFLVAVITTGEKGEQEVVMQPTLVLARNEKHAIVMGARLCQHPGTQDMEVLARPF